MGLRHAMTIFILMMVIYNGSASQIIKLFNFEARMMYKVKLFSVIPLLCLLSMMVGCTDEVGKEAINVEPMLYSVDYTLETTEGTRLGGEVTTRGIDYGHSWFTDEYPYNFIYVHSADNNNDGTHKSLRIPISSDVIACADQDCKGIRFQIQTNADGSYEIITEDGRILLGPGEKVYFSTVETPYWKVNQIENETTPIYHNDLFLRDPLINNEILRSSKVDDYSLQDLLNLSAETYPDIPLSRHCTGFRAQLMFTKRATSTIYGIEAEDFMNGLATVIEGNTDNAEKYSYEHFFIKLYIGPSFCHSFDMYNKIVPENDEGGYYVTNDNKGYEPFGIAEFSDFVQQPDGSTSSGVQTYKGFGYQTGYEDILLSPLNESISVNNPFSVYLFVKYSESLPPSEDFLTSNEGAFYYHIDVDMTTELNTVHRIVMVFNYEDLADVVRGSTSEVTTIKATTKSISNLHIMNIEPLKVFSTIE